MSDIDFFFLPKFNIQISSISYFHVLVPVMEMRHNNDNNSSNNNNTDEL